MEEVVAELKKLNEEVEGIHKTMNLMANILQSVEERLDKIQRMQ